MRLLFAYMDQINCNYGLGHVRMAASTVNVSRSRIFCCSLGVSRSKEMQYSLATHVASLTYSPSPGGTDFAIGATEPRD